ncbi:MAG: hypothetical protein NC318_08255 [Blautia sp.]|nr:hypothetical protein [Blautia sp.]MCM1221310.1 hypothetical protein [Lachnospiraceae bacterium]
MYSNLPNLVLAFHGCDEETYKKVLYDHEPLLPSINSYDWLGNGIYFWENNFSRAQEWAESYCERDHKKHPDKEKKKPAVIGAVIALGYCLNLTDYGSASILKNGYDILSYELSLHGKRLPVNKNVGKNSDLLLRELDCAVIQRIHRYNEEMQRRSYDSVRGVFVEGEPVYPESGIREKSHVQLCIVNPNCIKGYFKPLLPDNKWKMV